MQGCPADTMNITYLLREDIRISNHQGIGIINKLPPWFNQKNIIGRPTPCDVLIPRNQYFACCQNIRVRISGFESDSLFWQFLAIRIFQYAMLSVRWF